MNEFFEEKNCLASFCYVKIYIFFSFLFVCFVFPLIADETQTLSTHRPGGINATWRGLNTYFWVSLFWFVLDSSLVLISEKNLYLLSNSARRDSFTKGSFSLKMQLKRHKPTIIQSNEAVEHFPCNYNIISFFNRRSRKTQNFTFSLLLDPSLPPCLPLQRTFATLSVFLDSKIRGLVRHFLE